MVILLIHQNFPGQFKHLAPALVARGHRVVALTIRDVKADTWKGVELISYRVTGQSTDGIHPWLVDFETKVIRAQSCFQAALALKAKGLMPDMILAHPGWGETLFLKDVWPLTKLAVYAEYFYQPRGADVGFDPEFSIQDPGDSCRLKLKNLNNLLHFDTADAALSPTYWQASTYPEPFRSRIAVVHDGIDTQVVQPNAQAALKLTLASGESLTLTRRDEVITFVNRNLEPYRGYHVFMRALPEMLRNRPNARVLLVGGDDVSYGASPQQHGHAAGRKWKDIFADEVRPRISDADWARVHFLGHVPYNVFIPLLQLSTVHVYLTYPFVLSWSLLEAMSAGCAIVASRTAPVLEAIEHDVTGRLVDFFDVAGLAEQVVELLSDPAARARLGAAARQFAQARYDLETVCLPQQIRWLESI